MGLPLKERVRVYASELGFEACRFTAAAPPDRAAFFRQWLARGFHAEMSWLERQAEARCDPQRVLPGARAILLLAASYHRADRAPADPVSAGRGRIARYADFRDYHDVLRGPLASLVDQLAAWGGAGARSLAMVDSGPLMERDLAQRAGLGFIGKHTNLIGRQLGNWFFLAAVLTTIEFEPDPPEINRCGHCTRCLAACPTGALPAPFELDARRCISYLTIEHKGPIPLELRPLIGNRIFGCDDCLEACPWNRFAREGRILREHARPDLDAGDLGQFLALDEAAFKRSFHGTPILRVKWKGFLRNVCVALGNVGDAATLPALSRAAASLEPLVAEPATWAIRRIEERMAAVPPASPAT